MSNEKTVITDRGKVWLSKKYCQDNTILLGLGRTSPWIAEDDPPSPEKFEYELPELFAFVQVVVHRGLISDPNGDFTLADESKWTKVQVDDGENLEEAIVLANAQPLIIEVAIPHSQLPLNIDNYRAYGLFVDCSIEEEYLDSTVIPPDGVSVGTLEYLSYFSPVQIQNGFTHNLQLIRYF